MNSIYPIKYAYLVEYDDKKISFFTTNRNITINCYTDVAFQVFNQCNGQYSLEQVSAIVSQKLNSKYSIEFIKESISDLLSLKVLIDSREIMSNFHYLTENPSLFFRRTTEKDLNELSVNQPKYILPHSDILLPPNENVNSHLEKLLQKRYSCRSFSDKGVELSKIFSICKCAYSFNITPVASAGNLKPLSIFFINIVNLGSFVRGIYQYNPENDNINLISNEISDEQLKYALNDENHIFNSSCIFFVAADIERHEKKYSNRGYRFAILEVGHSVQNMTLSALELGIDSIEYGGFNDVAVSNLIGLSHPIYPISCFAIGYRKDDKMVEQSDFFNNRMQRFEQKLFEMGIIEGKSVMSHSSLQKSSLNVVVCKYSKPVPKAQNDNDRYGTGIGNTFFEANIKSIMEAYERYMCGIYYCDKECRATELDAPYLSPKVFAPYTKHQKKLLKLGEFSEDTIWQWVRGYNSKGEEIYIPVDLCFFPIDNSKLNRPLCHYANSSGCAANFDIETAKQSAILELIERDTLMRCWIEKKTPIKIDINSCSKYIANRAMEYQNKGFNIEILLISKDRAYSILVCAYRQDRKPFFVSGASSSFKSVDSAISKAFDEMEYSLLVAIDGKDTDRIDVSNVVTPVEHGLLYRNENHFDRIKFLFTGEVIDKTNILGNDIGKIEDLNIAYMIYKQNIDNVFVVRVFSSELLPINFGANSDFIEHPSLKKSNANIEYDGFPHFFA